MSAKPSLMFVSEELELGLVAALVRGLIKLDSVPVDALSKDGQAVCSAVQFLAEIGKPPFAKNSVLSAAVDVAGADKVALRPFLDKAMATAGGQEPAEIVRKLAEQQTLSEVMNIIQRQMAERSFDAGEIRAKLKSSSHSALVPASELIIGDKLPPIPTGYDIPSLPGLTEASGGVMGVWCVGGKAKVGKSTLGVQIALEMPVPVLYYDMENGDEVLMYRIGKAFGGDVRKVKDKTKRFYLRHNIKTLDQDLGKIAAPALVVVDSLQKLPTKLDQRRAGIDGWLAKFERLKEDGYSVLLISEVNGFGGFKESSEIEYTVDFGMQLRRDYGTGGVVATVVANRHRPHYGDICGIERVNDWWMKETEDLGQEDGL